MTPERVNSDRFKQALEHADRAGAWIAFAQSFAQYATDHVWEAKPLHQVWSACLLDAIQLYQRREAIAHEDIDRLGRACEQFEVEISEEDFCEFLDSEYPLIDAMGVLVEPSNFLKTHDPVRFRIWHNEHCATADKESDPDYIDLGTELREAEDELEIAQDMLSDLITLREY